MNYFSSVISLLRDRQEFLDEIQESVKLKSKISALMISSFCFFAIYGAIIGSSHSWQQALASAIKLPALYLITLLVCLPTLYIFNVLFGSRQSIAQHYTYLLTAVSVIAILLCGFAPVTLFFLLTVRDYNFFLLLNVCIFSLTGILGVSFLYKVMRPGSTIPVSTIKDASEAKGDFTALQEEVGKIKGDAGGTKVRTTILRFWLCLYGLVGTQLGWTLRPFFGSAGQFELFRPTEGSFFSGVWNALMNLLT